MSSPKKGIFLEDKYETIYFNNKNSVLHKLQYFITKNVQINKFTNNSENNSYIKAGNQSKDQKLIIIMNNNT